MTKSFQTIAGVLGNVLEWYDFALFGLFSDIIGQVFFPPAFEGDNSSLVKSFAIFGGAFLMRPIGGLTIGYVGDKYGRKKALTMSLFLMAFPTFAMGCLPTYEQAGGVSIVLLAICRLLQGMSVGGQLPASLVYTVEMKPREKWGYYGSFVMFAVNCGTLLGNLVGALLRDILTEEQLLSFGWRIPFLSGILIAFVAAWLRTHGDESHPNAGEYDHRDSEITNPIRSALAAGNRLALLAATLAPMLWAAGFYVSFVWMAIFMEELLESPIPHAFWINSASLFFGMMLVIPMAGSLSDVLGRRLTMTVSAISIAVLGPVMVFVISRGVALNAFFAQWSLGVMLSFYGGPICAWLVESFDPKVRLTSASLGYDLAHATAGGFSPLLATVLVNNYGITSPGLIYPVFAVTSLIGLYLLPLFGSTKDTSNIEAGQDVDNGDLGDLELKNEDDSDGEEPNVPTIT